MLAKIISGGQTGVDRAALDVALEFGIPCGGFCPKGRRAEDGRIPDRYPLTELDSDDYAFRTACNVDEADAVLILVNRLTPLTPGTRLTINTAKRQGKPMDVECLADAFTAADIKAIRHWLHVIHKGHTVMIAGPRESKHPGIGARAAAFLRAMLKEDEA